MKERANSRRPRTAVIPSTSRRTRLGSGLHGGSAQPEPKDRAAKWAGDIGYIRTREGWLCLAAILGLHSRRVIGWAASQPHETRSGGPGAEHGHPLRSPPQGCVFHSDRGAQYCSHDDRKILREHGLQASMSGKGNCYDNAAVETFFKPITAELIRRKSWETRRPAETAILQYINGFHNPRRRHSALEGKSPLAFGTPGGLSKHLERHKYVTGPECVSYGLERDKRSGKMSVCNLQAG